MSDKNGGEADRNMSDNDGGSDGFFTKIWIIVVALAAVAAGSLMLKSIGRFWDFFTGVTPS